MKYNDDFRRLNIDRMLAEHELDRRQHLRVRPGFLPPVLFNWQGNSYKILDISQGSFPFIHQVPIDEGWQLLGQLHLPRHDLPAEVKVVVVGSDDEGLVRCMFQEISLADQDTLARYIKDRRNELTSFYFRELAPQNP